VGELSVRAVDVTPLVVERHDLGHLVVEQAVHGAAARRLVVEGPDAAPAHPAIGAGLAEIELRARPAKAPAGVGGSLEQVEQRLLGGRVDTGGDVATQPQCPFPSTSMSFTAISLSASPRRAASARAASSSKSRALDLDPGLEFDRASSAPWGSPPPWRPCGSA
jgi:hypothetical protein